MRRKTKRKIPNYRKLYCKYHNLKEIPKGYHVHHKNKKRWDNRKENLILLTAKEHLSMHAKHRIKRQVRIYSADQMKRYYGL